MPIYEYRCQNCGNQIEVTQRMSDAPLVHCDKCGEDALKKLISATSFVLKGSGWYVTDYKGNKAHTSSASEASTSASSAATSDTKPSETKSEPKSEAPKAEASKPSSE